MKKCEMHIGQTVYAEIPSKPNCLYKGNIIEIRRKHCSLPLKILDCLCCFSLRPKEYKVRFQNDTTLYLPFAMIQTQL